MTELTMQFPRYPLTFGPSPIEPLPRLSKFLGDKVKIWAKREDCNSGLAFGGNKLRKLEFLVPDILAQGADTLVSIGGIQSNHTRQVAAVAAKLGLKCHLVQGSWVNWQNKAYDQVGNILLSRVLGAQLEFSKEEFSIAIKESWENALDKVRRAGGKPYAIPAGASDHPLGGLGYVAFADEVRKQERELNVHFDYVVIASASGSTQAGMVVGFARDNRSDSVIGIDVTSKPKETRAQILRIAQRTSELLSLERKITDQDIVLNERFSYPAYGIPSKETIHAIRLCACLEGMVTDPVYEGKSMQALISLVQDGFFPESSNVLYVHLGGVPAIDGYCELFQNEF